MYFRCSQPPLPPPPPPPKKKKRKKTEKAHPGEGGFGIISSLLFPFGRVENCCPTQIFRKVMDMWNLDSLSPWSALIKLPFAEILYASL